MKPDEQRIAIAGACGWKEIHRRNRSGKRDNQGVEIWGTTTCVGGVTEYQRLPDYLNDLNACHKFENLNSSGWLAYEVALTEVITRDHGECTKRHLINAEAAQRAEAFLRAKGLWIDEPPRSTPL